MIQTTLPQIWFVCGSQHLYGPKTLAEVEADARRIAGGLFDTKALPLPVMFKAVVKTPDEVAQICSAANADPHCAGLIIWMHTFSPSKMWIRGLNLLSKPFLHLHTQFERALPWDTIDMDFMNLNQSAHGDREAGFIHTRMRLGRKVVVGHWSDDDVIARIDAWQRAVRAWTDWQGARFCRFGDNMREVAVTEGDKVSAEMAFGFSTNGYGVGDLVARVDGAKESDVIALLADYEAAYDIAPELRKGESRHDSLVYGARLELGLRAFLEEGGFRGFTTTFEDLHGLRQLPGMAPQRLMADGHGFAGEGDWKTAALVRALKVMALGLPGGTSFMEDYTYDLTPGAESVLGARCPAQSFVPCLFERPMSGHQGNCLLKIIVALIALFDCPAPEGAFLRVGSRNGLDHRQCELSLAKIVADILADDRALPGIVQKIIDHLKGHAKRVAIVEQSLDLRLVRGCDHAADFGRGGKEGGGLAPDHLQIDRLVRPQVLCGGQLQDFAFSDGCRGVCQNVEDAQRSGLDHQLEGPRKQIVTDKNG